jgi:hypothetical protein
MGRLSTNFLARHPDALGSLLALLLPMSLILNGYLGWELHAAGRLALARQARAARAPALSVGTVVPPLTGKHLDGSSAKVDYTVANRPTLLYVLQPKCIWCKRNSANFQTLLKQAGGRFNVVCVSLVSEGLDTYAAANGLTAPSVEVVSEVPQVLRDTYHFSGTPEIIVLSKEGRVMAEWSGALQGKKMTEAEQFFGVKLPGIASD